MQKGIGAVLAIFIDSYIYLREKHTKASGYCLRATIYRPTAHKRQRRL